MKSNVLYSTNTVVALIGMILANNTVSTIMGYVYTILSIALLLVTLIFKIRDAMKDGKIDKKEQEDIMKTIDEIDDKLNDKGDNKDGK